jgi:hypothetical protein
MTANNKSTASILVYTDASVRGEHTVTITMEESSKWFSTHHFDDL